MLESPDDHAIARRIERNWATSAAEFTRTLHSLHTRWDGEVTPLGGGYAILAGPGLYVNRAVGLGLDGPVDEQAFCLLEDASVRVGVHPEIEITPLSDPSVRELAERRGYQLSNVRSVFVRSPESPALSLPESALEVVEVLDEDSLLKWQNVAAAAFSADSDLSRAASDPYATTSFRSSADRLFVALDPVRRPVACAALIVRERVATLGGMGVIPSARGHGFQRAMIDARVQLARLQGADLVTSSAVSQVSKNNLHACRFTRLYDQETWTRT